MDIKKQKKGFSPIIGAIAGLLITMIVLVVAYKLIVAGASKMPVVANLVKNALCKGDYIKYLSLCK